MGGWPTAGNSAYHDAAMIAHRTLLLACLALPPLSALAQTYAPAEDRPGRIVLVPMSVERPAGEGWALVRRTDTGLTFLHPADKEHNSLVAIASAKVPDKRLRSTDELAAQLRQDLKGMADDKRFKVLSEEVRPEAAPDRKCVRYRQQAMDLAAIDADGKAQLIDLHGQVCLHPADEGLVLAVTLSERATAGNAGRQNIAEAAERFFQGMRPHAPLKGPDWQPLAEQGDANAQVWIARALLQGTKPSEAIAWLNRAAEKGHPDAQALLGLSNLTGRAAARNPAEALKWLRMAAEKGYAKAEGLLALALITAPEVRNEEEGRRWVRKAATDGDPLGQALIGELLLFGRAGMEKNEAEGVAWTRKAAEQGDARAQYTLASLLANSIGVEKDLEKAHFWLELSAAQGNPDARKVLDQAKRPAGPATAPATAPTESK